MRKGSRLIDYIWSMLHLFQTHKSNHVENAVNGWQLDSIYQFLSTSYHLAVLLTSHIHYNTISCKRYYLKVSSIRPYKQQYGIFYLLFGNQCTMCTLLSNLRISQKINLLRSLDYAFQNKKMLECRKYSHRFSIRPLRMHLIDFEHNILIHQSQLYNILFLIMLDLWPERFLGGYT